MSSGHEIITLQLGHFSNYIGAHFWNLQRASFQFDTPKSTSFIQPVVQNIQEPELFHDVLFRESTTRFSHSYTYCPRLVAVDLAGSLGVYPRGGLLEHYSSLQAATQQSGNPADLSKRPGLQHVEDVANAATRLRSNSEQVRNLIEGVDSIHLDHKPLLLLRRANLGVQNAVPIESLIDSWTDIVVTDLHPRSITLIDTYKHRAHNPASSSSSPNPAQGSTSSQTNANADTNPPVESEFATFAEGQALLSRSSEAFAEEFEDNIRYMAEECDLPQGFHLLADSFDGFAGLGTRALDELHQEFPKKAVLVVPVGQSHNPAASGSGSTEANSVAERSLALRLVNAAHLYTGALEYCSALLPLDLSARPWRPPESAAHAYLSSSLLAAALDVASTPYRLKRAECALSDLCELLAPTPSRKLLSLSSSLPFPLAAHGNLFDTFAALSGESESQSARAFLTAISPEATLSKERAAVRFGVLRGVSREQLFSSGASTDARIAPEIRHRFQSPVALLEQFGTDSYPGCLYRASASADPLSLHFPFPFHVLDSDLLALHQLSSSSSSSSSGTASGTASMVGGNVLRVPAMSELANGPGSGRLLRALHEDMRALGSARLLAALPRSGGATPAGAIEQDDLIELMHSVLHVADNYSDENHM